MPKQARAHATRELIVQAAATVFSTKTYAQATLSDVLREAGVTQGALYFHFESKKALAQEVIDRQHNLFMAAGSSLTESTRGLPAMVVLSRGLAAQITSNVVVRAGLRLSTESVEVFTATASKPYEDWIATAEVLVKRAIADGDIDAGQDPARLAAFVIGSFTGVQTLSQARTGWTDLLDRLEEMWDLMIPGLTGRARSETDINVAALIRD